MVATLPWLPCQLRLDRNMASKPLPLWEPSVSIPQAGGLPLQEDTEKCSVPIWAGLGGTQSMTHTCPAWFSASALWTVKSIGSGPTLGFA
jgi:hypothetical protein